MNTEAGGAVMDAALSDELVDSDVYGVNGLCEASEINPSPESTSLGRFGADGEYTMHLASSPRQRLTCWNLVYQEYLTKGYVRPQQLPLRYSRHDALPETGTFLVERNGEPVGTISVFPDSALGLPADDIYRAELDGLRAQGRMPAEIGRLTIAPKFAKERKVLMQMIEMPCLYARRVLQADDVIITVNPAHTSFYGRMMLFSTLGEQKSFESVCGAPAVLMRMDLAYQAELIRHAQTDAGSGLQPLRHTVYRSFRGEEEEDRIAKDIICAQQSLPPEFLRRYFVHERTLFPYLRIGVG